jgi:hypothetical protein
LLVGSVNETQVPGTWASGTRNLQPRFAVPLCVGNYPQVLGDPGKLIASRQFSELAELDSASRETEGASSFGSRSIKGQPELSLLIAIAGARLSGRYEQALAAVAAAEPTLNGAWRAALENERAAVLWEVGMRREAIAFWEQLPDGPVKSFNLGMAALFTDATGRAATYLGAACATLPDDCSWKHLANLYLVVCVK